MLIYSETSKVFIQRVREEIRALFVSEVEPILPLKFNRSRILYKNFQFPISIVVFEDNSRFGYFDYRFYEIGISKKLMYSAFDEVMRNIIRHELAHYIAYLLYGPDLGHGEEFNNLCRKLNWGQEVFRAYSNLELENKNTNNPHLKNIELLNRVKKLLNLASSDNPHESEQATIRANKLILEYNLSFIKDNVQDEVYVERVLEAKKKNAKHMAIYEILKTFYVSPVFNHGKSSIYLEIVGDQTNVELASYVCSFLDHELDRLWKLTKKNNPHLQGMSAKNSFFRGISKGYLEKINTAKSEFTKSNDLILIEKNLSKNLAFVYSRLGSSATSVTKNNQEANHLGQVHGKNLSIKPGLNNSRKKTYLLD